MVGPSENARSVVYGMASALYTVPIPAIAALAPEVTPVVAMPIVIAVGIMEGAIPTPIAIIEGAIGAIVIAIVIVATYGNADPFVTTKATIVPGHAAAQYQRRGNNSWCQPDDFCHVKSPKWNEK
jgi:hypothetical protein